MTPNRPTRTFLILLFVAAPGFSQSPALPDTPAGHVLSAWLDAFNSGDRARLAAFDAKHDGRDPDYAENQLRFRGQTGGFDLTGIHSSAPTYIEYLATERASGRQAMGMIAVSASEPPKVLGSQMRLMMPGATLIG